MEGEEQGISRSSGRVEGLCGFERSHEEFKKVQKDACDFFDDEGVSFDCWVDGQVRRILASRSAFSFFCMKSICSCRSGRYGTASTALFPIPVPYLRAWTSARGRGAKQRRSQALQKLLNIAVMALNFEYLRSPLSVVHLLRRPPAAHHHRVFERLGWFIKACATTERVSYLGCGRKSFQFGARVNELVNALTKIGAVSSSPYSRACSVGHVPLDNEVAEELRPYRDLDPSRLRLSGRGQWNCEDYLSDYLWLVFKEPRVNCFDIRPPRHLVPDVTKEKKQKIFELCQIWDKQELLAFCPVPALPDDLRLAARVFNNYKNASADRQIGDRRGQNFREGVLQHGQSRYLPSGSSLLQLCPQRYHEELIGAVTDRRDYYHQFFVTPERSSTNFLYPFFRVDEIRSFGAYGKLFEEWGGSSKKRRKREVEGDYLGVERPSILWSDDLLVAPCFSALFQGDHLGVEFATEAHSGILMSYGLLSHHNRLQAGVCLQDDRCAQGLYIDDFFAISREKLGNEATVPPQAMSSLAFHRAKEAYAAEKVFGSDDKDVLGSRCFRVVGAEVDSRRFLVDGGVVSCGLPAEKRLALAYVASVAASLPVTSDALHSSLVGSLISMLMYRRPAMSVLQEVFHVIPPSELNTLEPKMWRLSRAAASEFAVISALAPILVTNLATPALPKLYATDASLAKGGITEAEIDPELAKILWRDADRRGSNVPIHSRARAVLRSSDPWFEETGEAEFRPDEFSEGELSSEESGGVGESVLRPIGLCFDFFEVCGGSGVVTKRLASMGVVCGPILDLTYSPHYDLTENRLLAWALFMMEQRRVKAFLVAPPCTTFSPAAHPALRSYSQPQGYNLSHPRVIVGNLLAYASLCLLFAGLRLKIFGLGEQPRRSKMRWLAQWRRLLALGAREAFLASCMYGSIHQKEFCFVGVNMKVELLERRCSRDHGHIRIEGRYTRPSAVYCEGLAEALARFYRDHLSAHARTEERLNLQVAGLEDQISNELCLALDWRTSSSWRWKGSSHVNLLETAATLKLYRTIAWDGGDARFTYLGDSHVSRSSLARGRTSSHAMRPLLRQASSLCLAYGLYPAGRYAPTRWNPSDHPTRDTQIPAAIPQRLLDLPARDLIWICSLPKLKRWASNWVRLVLLISPHLASISSDGISSRRHASSWILPHEWSMDFDSSLGFPGEGPPFLQRLSFVIWIPLFGFCSALSWSTRVNLIRGVISGHIVLGCHGVAEPIVNAGDRLRQRARDGLVLDDGRPVTAGTKASRDDLLVQLEAWLNGRGRTFGEVFLSQPPDFDEINKVLTDYGRMLFRLGKPYYKYAETLNGVTTRRPILRRSIGAAWDLAFMWGALEPTEHHAAMPHQVLLAVISTCLVWGWTREAACFALAWGALLRIGEVVMAFRRDLILPADVNYSVNHLLLRIVDPKTRFRAARHQVGKMEQPDLILVVQLGFGSLAAGEKLWPFTSSTLRHRLRSVLQKLDLPWKAGARPKQLNLASLRAGGATWLISQSESSELVRRRGRWVSQRTMEIYIQEVMASTFMTDIDEACRNKVLKAMDLFLEILSEAIKFHACHIPQSTWVFLFSAGKR